MLKLTRPSSKNWWLLLAVLASVAAVASGCGGSNSSGASSTASAEGKIENTAGIKPFLGKKYKEKRSSHIVAFGSEATAAEREAASAVLTENFEARAAAEFATQCESLGVAGLKALLGKVKSEAAARAECPKTLKKVAEPLNATEGARANNLSGPIQALRVENDKAYALYHASNGAGFAVPMEKEGGEWRVGALLAIALE